MVIDNIFKIKKTNSSKVDEGKLPVGSVSEYPLAEPIDRLAASIIDISIILLPLILLLSSPVKKVLVSAVLIQDELMFLGAMVAMAFITLITVVSYQAIFLYFFGATIGKMVFHLKVRDIWHDQPLLLSTAVVRSFLWFVETALFMLPHITIFSDSRRRPWHDRVANTIVICKKQRTAGPPNVFEITFAKAILSSIVAICLLFVVIQFERLSSNLAKESLISDLLDGESGLCPEVDWAKETWPGYEKNAEEGRVQIALALFAAGEASKDCLKQEVSVFLNQAEKESPVAYLGQAFIHSSDPDLSNQYLHRICEIDPYSSSCAMAKIVENWSDSNWVDVDLGFHSFAEIPPTHISVWAIRHYTKQRNFIQAASFIDALSPQKALASFLSLYRVKVLWGMQKKSEVRVIADTAMESLPQDSRLRLASWLCQSEYRNDGCGAFNKGSCKVIQREINSSLKSLIDPEIAMISVHESQCFENQRDLGLASMTLFPIQMQKYMEITDSKKTGESVISELAQLKNEIEGLPELKLQIELDLIESMKLGQLLEKVEGWRDSKKSESWSVIGAKLMSRLNDEGKHTEAKAIGETLLGANYRDDYVLKPLLFAQYQTGEFQKAWAHAQILLSQSAVENESSARSPASVKNKNVSNVESVIQSLKERYGR